MARIRTIKPEFPQSESMGRISRESRLCFILLWTMADDVGRLRGNSRMLASLLYPYDDDARGLIDGWLDQLETEHCICRYQVGPEHYIQICNWLSHQKIDRPSKSKFPAYPEPSRTLANPREDSSLDQGSRIKEGIKGTLDVSLESFDGDLAFRHLCSVYKKAENSVVTQRHYLEAVESVVSAKKCSRTDAAGFIAHKAELYCSLIEPKFQKGLTSWLEMKIFNQQESVWGLPKPALVSRKNPAEEMRRQLEGD